MFRGEAISLSLYGDEQYDLRDIDFSVYIYKDGCPSTDIKKTKSECTLQEDGSYLCRFDASQSAALPLCSYTIEVHDGTNDVIFIQKHAFSLEQSASAIDINNGESGEDNS